MLCAFLHSCCIMSDFETPWIVACQARLSLRFSRPRLLEWVVIFFSKWQGWNANPCPLIPDQVSSLPVSLSPLRGHRCLFSWSLISEPVVLSSQGGPAPWRGAHLFSSGAWCLSSQSRNSNLPESSDQSHLFMAMLLCQSSRLNGHFTEALNSMRWTWGNGQQVTITSQLLIKPTFEGKKKAIAPFALLPS